MKMKRRQRILGLGLAALLAWQALAAGAQAADQEAYTRIAGQNRYETSEKTGAYRESKTLVLASGQNFADALSSSNLVHGQGARLKLVGGGEDLAPYIQEQGIEKVYLVGGQSVLPDSLVARVPDSVPVVRLAGANRYETNLRTLEEAGYQKVGLASGQVFADALAASRLLLEENLGLLLAQPQARELPGAYQVRYIFGGSRTLAYDQGERIAGANRFETAVKIAAKTQAKNQILVDGRDFPDALSAINLVASQDADILLAPESRQAGAQIRPAAGARLFVVGGQGAVSQAQVDLVLGKKPSVDEELAEKVRAEVAQGRLVFEGIMRRMDAADVIAFQGLKNPLQMQIEDRNIFWVLTLRQPARAPFMSIMGTLVPTDFNMVSLPIEDYDPAYEGKNVLLSIRPETSYLAGDPGLPQGQPSTSDYRILGIKEDERDPVDLKGKKPSTDQGLGDKTGTGLKQDYQEFLKKLQGKEMVHASGVGGWYTKIEMAQDGRFEGVYHNRDGQEVTRCEFEGKMDFIKQLDQFTYEFRLVEFRVTSPTGTERKVKDTTIKYIEYFPDLFADVGDRLYGYGLGRPATSLTLEEQMVLRNMAGKSDEYMIFNPKTGIPFVRIEKE